MLQLSIAQARCGQGCPVRISQHHTSSTLGTGQLCVCALYFASSALCLGGVAVRSRCSAPSFLHPLQAGQPLACSQQQPPSSSLSPDGAALCVHITALSSTLFSGQGKPMCSCSTPPYLCTFSGGAALLQVLQCFASSPLPRQGSPTYTHSPVGAHSSALPNRGINLQVEGSCACTMAPYLSFWT